MQASSPFPVVIAGAGPVGLSLALGLLRRGLFVLVFEQRPLLAMDPRATTLQPPTLEMLGRLGVLREVLSAGRRVDTLEYWDWTKPRRLASLSLGALAMHTEAPYRVHLPQPQLCQILLNAIEALQPGTVQFGATLKTFVDHGSSVDVEVSQRGRKRKLRASWLCAADGTRSSIRSSLGIEMAAMGPPDTFFTFEVGLDADAGHAKTHDVKLAHGAYLFTNAGWAAWMRMPESIRVLLSVDDDADVSTEGLARIHDTLFGWNNTVTLHNRARYKVRQQVATSWRTHRVVLVGDAAHSTFPVTGTAMNSGIHDGFTLSQVLKEDGDLTQWESERKEEVRTRVAAYANTTYRQLNANGLFSRRARDHYLERLERDEDAAVDHLLRHCMLEGRAGPPPELDAPQASGIA